MNIVCLDLEGVLIPEIWIAFAEKTGIEALKRTTRDEPDYDLLMRYRLDILDKEGFKLADIDEVIGTLDPLPGAIGRHGDEVGAWRHGCLGIDLGPGPPTSVIAAVITKPEPGFSTTPLLCRAVAAAIAWNDDRITVP